MSYKWVFWKFVDRPEIATQLQNDTRTEGRNVTLTCNATGNPEPVLSWSKDGNLAKSSNRISFLADNKLLKITNVKRSDGGKYMCVAYNEVGNTSSKIAILNVQCKWALYEELFTGSGAKIKLLYILLLLYNQHTWVCFKVGIFFSRGWTHFRIINQVPFVY